MAFNEVSLPQWQLLVRRVFGLTGPGGNIPVIAPEITPVVVLQPDNPEFRRLRLEKLWAMQESITGGAGTKATIGLINPEGSGALVVVERVQCSFRDTGGGGAVVQLKMDTEANIEAATSLDSGSSPRDSREGLAVNLKSAAQVRVGNLLAGALPGFPLNGSIVGAANVVAVLEQKEPIILTPGFGIITGPAVNSATLTNVTAFQWYERPLESAEATG